MKKFLILCALAGTAFGQGSRYDNNVFTSSNNVPPGSNAPLMSVPYAKVSVCAVPATGTPCTNYAAIYSDIAMTQPITQPFTADIQGRYGFFSAAGTYSYTACKGLNCATGVVTVAGAGGGTPGGADTQLQLNVGNTAFGGAPLFKAGSANPAYTSGTTYTTAPFARQSFNGASPYGGTDYFSHQTQCVQNAVLRGGIEGHICELYNPKWFAPGWNSGNGTLGNQGWTVNKVLNYDQQFFTPGISQLMTGRVDFSKTGDDAFMYAYCFSKGGWVDASGEGHTCIKANGGQSGSIYAGTAAQTVTRPTSLAINNYGDNLPLVGGWIMDISTPLATGNVTAIGDNSTANTPGVVTTVDTHPVSVAYGNTTTQINNTPNVPTGNSKTVTVHFAGGSGTAYTSGAAIFFACDNYPDAVTPTAVSAIDGSGNQTITGNFQYSHEVGCPTYQGGGYPAILDFVKDRVGQGSGSVTDYLIAGAKTSTTYDYREYKTGAQGAIWALNHNAGQTATASTLTRTANVVKACTVPLNYSGQYVTVVATDTSFNGTFVAGTMDINQCVSWAQTATNATTPNVTVTTGGVVGGANGTGAYQAFPAAQIASVGTSMTTVNGVSQLAFNGTVNLFPNNMVITTGDNIYNPYQASNKITMGSFEASYYTPPTNGNEAHFDLGVQGPGVSTYNFHTFEMMNNNQFSQYIGGGGTGLLQGAQGIYSVGPYSNHIAFDAPIAQGIHDLVRNNPAISTGAAYAYYFPRVLETRGGLFGYYERYQPAIDAFTATLGSDSGDQGNYVMKPGEFDINFALFKLSGGVNLPGLASGLCTTGIALDGSNNVVKTSCGGGGTVGLTGGSSLVATVNYTGPSVIVTGVLDGKVATNAVTTSTTFAVTNTYSSGFWPLAVTANAPTAGTLPTAVQGSQYCFFNKATFTSPITLQTAAAGQFIDVGGTLTASGGYVVSGGALGDAACLFAQDATTWKLFIQGGTWTAH